MGAWGTGILENDTAGDWLFDFEENQSVEFLAETLDAVFEDDYLDSDVASEALAAIELVLFILKDEDDDRFEDLELTLSKDQLDSPILKKCIKCIERIQDKNNNELYELWEESDSFEEWKTNIVELGNRIKG
ncbi:MAG: DUF4259 domain-containing protein [Bacteroidales bacterium]